jgi:hypothetical protein
VSLGGGGTLASLVAARLSFVSAFDERVACVIVITDRGREGTVAADLIWLQIMD